MVVLDASRRNHPVSRLALPLENELLMLLMGAGLATGAASDVAPGERRGAPA